METSSKRFRSKVDAWLGLVLIASSIVCIGVVVAAAFAVSLLALLVLAPIFLLGAALPVWLLRSTYYVLGQQDLLVRSGPFAWTLPLNEIQTVSPTRSPLSAPALSLDRLRIDYAGSRSLMISPEDRSSFTARLEESRKNCVAEG